MNDAARKEDGEEAEVTKTRIRPDLNRYVRDKSGSGKRTHRTDDLVARTLAGKDLEAIKSGAKLLGINVEKWEALNPGQQRMLIGNALRHRLADAKAPLLERELADVYGEPVPAYVAPEPSEAATEGSASEAPGDATVASGDGSEVSAEAVQEPKRKRANR